MNALILAAAMLGCDGYAVQQVVVPQYVVAEPVVAYSAPLVQRQVIRQRIVAPVVKRQVIRQRIVAPRVVRQRIVVGY